MARRTQAVVYALRADPASESLYPDAELSSGVRREAIDPVAPRHGAAFAHQYALKRQTSGYLDTTATTATVRHSTRGGVCLVEWAAVELHYSEPATTTVEARLHTGAQAYFWDGGSWEPADAGDWNTPTEVEANFSAFGASTSQTLTVEWRMQTSDRELTPVVYGAVMVGRLHFAARTGTTATATRSDGWTDDVIHRVLIPWLMGASPEWSDEGVLVAETSVLDYSEGVAERPIPPNAVQSVHNLDTDPNMLSPLSGTWDPGTLTYTLDSPLAAGARYSARMTIKPEVAFVADETLFEARLPHIIVEGVSVIEDESPGGWEYIRDVVAGTAIRVRKGQIRVYRASILIQAQDPVIAFEVHDSIRRLLDGTEGTFLVSEGTGMPVSIAGKVRQRPARGGAEIGGQSRFDLRLTAREYHGTDATVPLVDEDGPTFQVADDRVFTVRPGA